MAASNPPTRGEAFDIYIALRSVADPRSLQAAPTIAAGDFKVSKDGGALANLATLPAVGPAASMWVLISLSATEMTADTVAVQCIDQTTPKEWADYAFCIPTTA